MMLGRPSTARGVEFPERGISGSHGLRRGGGGSRAGLAYERKTGGWTPPFPPLLYGSPRLAPPRFPTHLSSGPPSNYHILSRPSLRPEARGLESEAAPREDHLARQEHPPAPCSPGAKLQSEKLKAADRQDFQGVIARPQPVSGLFGRQFQDPRLAGVPLPLLQYSDSEIWGGGVLHCLG